MPTTFDYKVRDQDRQARQGPARGRQHPARRDPAARDGLRARRDQRPVAATQPRDQDPRLHRPRQAEGGRGHEPPARDDGRVRPDPGPGSLASSADQVDYKQLAATSLRRSGMRGRAGLVALGRPRASTRRSSARSTSRWSAPARRAASSTRCSYALDDDSRSRSSCAEGQVGDDLPGRRRSVVVILIVTAMMIFVVPTFKTPLRDPQREAPAADADRHRHLERPGERWLLARDRRSSSPSSSAPCVGSRRPRGANVGTAQAPAAGVRPARAQDRPRRFARRSPRCLRGRADHRVARHRRRQRREPARGRRPSRERHKASGGPLARVGPLRLPGHADDGHPDDRDRRGVRCPRRHADKIAAFYDNEVRRPSNSLTSMLEPLIIVFMGVCIGAIVISLYLPMFDYVKLVQKLQ